MYSKFTYLFFGATLIVLLNVSCEKKIVDYRNKFCGDYFFSVDKTFTIDTETTKTHWGYNGKVSYDKSEDADLIIINYSEMTNLWVQVSKKGQLSLDADMLSINGQFYEKDSLVFTYYYIVSPAAAGYTKVKGIRKK